MEQQRYLDDIMSFFEKNPAAFKRFNSKNYTFSDRVFSAQTQWFHFSFSLAHDRYYIRDGHYLVDCHKHSSPEILLSLHGNLGYTDQNNQELYIPAGCFCVFPAGFLHRQFRYQHSGSLAIAADLQFSDTPEGRYLSHCFQHAPFSALPMSDSLLDTLRRLAAEIAEQRPCADVVIGNLLSTVIVEAARAINPHFEAIESDFKPKDGRAEEVALFVRSNLASHLTQQDFEIYFGMSIKQLNRIMRKYYDLSVFEFLRKERIHKAKKLLTKTGVPLKEIARQVGYSDEFSLSKAFKQIEGVSPSQYRRAYHTIHTE